jgi:hypothetical protein
MVHRSRPIHTSFSAADRLLARSRARARARAVEQQVDTKSDSIPNRQQFIHSFIRRPIRPTRNDPHRRPRPISSRIVRPEITVGDPAAPRPRRPPRSSASDDHLYYYSEAKPLRNRRR